MKEKKDKDKISLVGAVSMGTGVMILEGTYDSKTKTMSLSGTMVDPISGADMNVKEVITYISEDTHKFEMFIV